MRLLLRRSQFEKCRLNDSSDPFPIVWGRKDFFHPDTMGRNEASQRRVRKADFHLGIKPKTSDWDTSVETSEPTLTDIHV